MPDFRKTIEVTIDTVADKAKTGLAGLKTSVGEADGAFGKLKAGGKSAFDTIGSAGPAALAGVGAAVGAFALSAINEFADLALSAEAFSTAAGTSVEDASRWIEVAGDLGVNADAVQAAMGRLNREAADGKLAKFGITAQDANGRLLETLTMLANIPDAGERAKASFDLLGKGGAALAPLLANVDTLKARLQEVSDQKVIDQEEVDKAREFTDAMDALSDRFGDFKLAIGGALISSLANAGQAIDNVVGSVQTLKDAIPGGDLLGNFDLLNPISQLENLTDGLSRATDFSSGWQNQIGGLAQTVTGSIPVIGGWAGGLFAAEEQTDETADAQTQLANELANAQAAMEEQTQAAADAEAALAALQQATLAQFNSQLGFNQASSDAADKVADYTAKLAISSDTATLNTETIKATTEAADGAAKAALGQAAAAVQLATDQAKANGETLTAAQRNEILTSNLQQVAGTLAPGNPLRVQLEGYISQLNAVPDSVSTDVEVSTARAEQKLREWESQPRSITYTVDTITSRTQAAAGTPDLRMAGGGMVTVGETGEENVFLPNGSHVVPTDRTRGWTEQAAADAVRSMTAARAGRPVTNNITVKVDRLSSDSDLMRLVARMTRRYERLNGSVRTS